MLLALDLLERLRGRAGVLRSPQDRPGIPTKCLRAEALVPRLAGVLGGEACLLARERMSARGLVYPVRGEVRLGDCTLIAGLDELLKDSGELCIDRLRRFVRRDADQPFKP